MANYTYGVSLLIANVAIAISAVGYGTELFGATLSPVQIGTATIGVLWICTVANFGGARITGQLSSITVWGVIIPVVGLCIIGWFWFSPTLYANSTEPAPCAVLQRSRLFYRHDALGLHGHGIRLRERRSG